MWPEEVLSSSLVTTHSHSSEHTALHSAGFRDAGSLIPGGVNEAYEKLTTNATSSSSTPSFPKKLPKSPAYFGICSPGLSEACGFIPGEPAGAIGLRLRGDRSHGPDGSGEE